MMKKIVFLLSTFVSCYIFAQAPQKINYQGLARDAAGIPITSLSVIGVEFKISQHCH